jgi:hypothetical protein
MRSDWRVIIGADFEACGGRKEMICLADCRHILGLLVQGWPTAKVARDVHRKRGNPGCPEGVRAGSSVSEVREAFVTTPATMYGNPDELSTLIRLPYLIIRSELRQN